MLQGLVLAVLLGLIGGLYPAWSAAKLPPVEGLRHD
jgi:putative ABC transport system permease protein